MVTGMASSYWGIYSILTLSVIVFTIAGMVKSRSSEPVTAAQNEQSGKKNNILIPIAIFIVQLFLILIISKTMMLFVLVEIAAIPTILIHIWAKGKGSQNIRKRNSIKRIGALIAFLYCKVIYLALIYSVTRGIITSQNALMLFAVLEAASLYISVSHMILGVRSNKGLAGTYQDLGSLLAGNGMKPLLVVAAIGAFVNFVLSLGQFIPFVILPAVMAVAHALTLVFFVRCYGMLKKKSMPNAMMLLSGLGCIAGIASAFILASREFQMYYLSSYVTAYRTANIISNIAMIAFPVALLLEKQIKILFKVFAGATAVLGSLSLAADLETIPYSPAFFALGQLCLFLLFILIACKIKQKNQVTAQQHA